MRAGDSQPSEFGLSVDRIWQSSLAVSGVLGLALILLRPLNGNIQWLVETSGALFSGHLYLETGSHYSPVAFAFYWLLGRFVSPENVGNERWFLLVLALAMLPAALFSVRILAGQFDSLHESRCLFLTVLFALFVVPEASFGTTPHLFIVATLPFLLVLLARIRGTAVERGRAVLAGSLAGFGIWVAPEYLPCLLLALGLLASFGAFRFRRPEQRALLGSFLGLAFLVWGVQPGYFPEFYRSLLSFAAFQLPPLADPWGSWEVLALALGLWLAVRLLGFEAREESFLAICTLGLTGIAWMFSYDFGQHLQPARVLACLLIVRAGFLLVSLLQSPGTTFRGGAILAVLTVTALVLATSYSIRSASRTWMLWSGSVPGRFEKEFDERLAGQDILFLCSSYWPGQPVSNYLGTHSILSESLLWDLPRYYPQGFSPRSSGEMSPEERQHFESVVETFLSSSPSAVVVDEGAEKIGFGSRPFDYLAYFSQDSRFRSAWEDYSLSARIGPFSVFLRKEY